MLLGTPWLNGNLGEMTWFFIISLGQNHNFVVYCKGNRWIRCKICAGFAFYDEVSAEGQGNTSTGLH